MFSSSTDNQTSSTQSLSSWLDSSATSVLDASGWNHQKANRPVVPRSKGSDGDGVEKENASTQMMQKPRHLLRKRYYQRPSSSSLSSSTFPATTSTTTPKKSELETLVLMDCLSNHFLFSHLEANALHRLIDAFEKVTARDHEVILRKGEPSQYLYMVYAGAVQGLGGNDDSTTTDKYTVFGELSLLTQAPSDVTITADGNSTLFRLEQAWIQQAVHPPMHKKDVRDADDLSRGERVRLIQSVLPPEVHDILNHTASATTALDQMAAALQRKSFHKDDILLEPSQRAHGLVIVAQGKVAATDVSLADRTYDDQIFGPGEAHGSFGWQSLLNNDDNDDDEVEQTFRGQMVAATNGIAWVLSKVDFYKAIGIDDGGSDGTAAGQQQQSSLLNRLAAKRLARTQLQQIPMIQDSALTDEQIQGLLDVLHAFDYAEGDVITKSGTKVDASMSFVRHGRVQLTTGKGENQTIKVVEAGGYFGESNLLLDQNKDGHKHFEIRSPMTIVALTSPTQIDVLYLEECRKVIDTTLLGLGRPPTISAIDDTLRWEDLRRHTLLGAGSFGQVWLASSIALDASVATNSDPADNIEKNDNPESCYNPRTVALKVQSKHRLLQANQAQGVVAERNILASLHSPFIMRLYNAFQDESCLYMVTSLLQGGELESLIPQDGLSESAAKFYAAGILEALAYMHQRHILHRDVKTENVLLDDKGYPVLIDFGFAKYVPDKTFTFCGSPMYTAPEIIRFKGHDRGCDYWSWAVLVYRLVTGKYPFYKEGMGELDLYKRICKGTLELDGQMSFAFRMLMTQVLYPDPSQRLGSSRKQGWREIFDTTWFATFELRALRKRELTPPWVPGLQDSLDASRFHHDPSGVEDWMTNETSPVLSEEQQLVFSTFGPQVSTN